MTCSKEKGKFYLRIIWFCWKKDIGLKWVKVSIVKEHQVHVIQLMMYDIKLDTVQLTEN